MCKIKEPQYFSLGDVHLSARAAVSQRAPTLESYRELFEGLREEKAIGEASTTYLDSARAAKRIKQMLPEVKMIAVLRDPAQRAHSHFMYSRKRFFDDVSSLREALALEETRLAAGWGPRFKYLGKGFYYVQLSEYYRLFDEQQIRVFLYDDLKVNPLGMIQEIFRFLEVDDSFEPDMRVKYNVSGLSRNQAVDFCLRALPPVRSFLEQKLPPRLVSWMGRLLMRQESQAPNLRQELIEVYREDVIKLQGLIGRDLSAWLR